jgi:hypothetical protein
MLTSISLFNNISFKDKQFKINSKFPKGVNGTATKCRVYTVHEKLKMTIFVFKSALKIEQISVK